MHLDENHSHAWQQFLAKDSMEIEFPAMIKSPNNSKYQAFASYLKTEREMRGLTVRDVAKMLDEPHQTIVRIENGERKLSVHEYVQYCSALELDLSKGLKFLAE